MGSLAQPCSAPTTGSSSNVSLILGFAGSGVDSTVVRLAGLAGAVAGGISMAAGEWVSVSAQNDLIRRELAIELNRLEMNPEFETAELAERYESHGMAPEQAAQAAAEVMQSPVDALAVHAEELGIDPDNLASPWMAAGISLACFLFGALLPLSRGSSFGNGAAWASLIIGMVAAAIVAASFDEFAERSISWAMLRQVLIVIGACGVTYLIGEFRRSQPR